MFTVVRVVHNYGHEGSGVRMCWGCAHDVADILKDVLCRQDQQQTVTMLHMQPLGIKVH